jgi:RNA polymerase sigma-70 factor, ECF subfamily
MSQFSSHIETALLEDLKRAAPQAVQTWYLHYTKPLEKFIAGKVDNAQDVEELVHDTFMSCLKHLPLFRGESSIKTWMVRIAQHEIADYYRRKYAKKVIKTLSVNEFSELASVETSYEISQKVKSVLRKMSASSRELLQRKYVDKQHVKTLAQELGRSAKGVEGLLFRARAEFRELYALESRDGE